MVAQHVNTKKIIRFIAVLICLVLIPSFTVYAGDINDNEASVLAVANGTFQYEGRYYRAKSEYISELYNFLADDDTDLTADQAGQAIEYIFGNVKEGIDSGYVYEVSSDNNSDSTDDNLNDTSDKNSSLYDLDSDTNQNPFAPKTNDPQKGAKELSDKELDDLFKRIDDNRELREKTRKIATDTDASIILDETGMTISTGDGETTIYKDTRIIPRRITMSLLIVGLSILVINVILLIILISSGCMRFKKQEKSKRREGHRRRRKIRKICRRLMTVTTTIGISLVCFLLAATIGIFNTSRIVQNIQTSGYFRTAYTDYVSEQVEKGEEYDGYDVFIIREKVAIDKTLSGSESADESSINSRSIAPYIKRMQKDVKSDVIVTFILSITAILIAAFSNIFMDLRRDRGVKSIAISIGVSAGVILAVALLLKLVHLETRFFLEPGYLYSFMEDQIEWIIKVFAIIGLFTTAFAASLVGLYKTIRKDR